MNSAEMPGGFRELLQQSGLRFSLPPGFAFVAPKANDSVAYQCAISLPEPKLEIRYQVVSLKPESLPAGYTSITGVNLNAMYSPNLVALIFNIADHVMTDVSPFPAEAVRGEFGADWGAVCRLALKKGSVFSDGYKECMLMTLHRDDRADATVFFMFDDYEAIAGLVGSNFYTLTFAT